MLTIATSFKNTKFNNLDTIKESFLNASTVVKKAAMGGLGASAVNIAWALDDVFIAKVSSNINDQKPSDMDLPILGDDARTCDNNGTCYFFVVAQEISHISKNKWVAAKGLDRVANYNMTLLDIAESAAWYQSQFGGYPSAPNSSALLESIQNDESRPSLSFFVNLPVVNYDSAKAVSSSDISTTSKDKKPTSEEEFLSTVAHEVSTLKDWPYAKMWSK
ncbi:hypothetical protein N7532_000025 [Penicillium argentinense]|uniref:Uncharacterized protein n=1 Tax=Penicillium argentinense TaxID=1131581 RepID=A0A9W9G5D4_9EURO|nr:uncharacterized protein N7532_000025 [Penicillium argentinense]KAJ5111980.1 hypothetical protein N7532_000025 [Penicillium argentinense]